MKKGIKLLAIMGMVLMCFVGYAKVQKEDVSKTEIETVIAAKSATIEVKEHLKLDNAEYKSAVITNSGFGNGLYYVSIGAMVLGALVFLRKLFKQAANLFSVKTLTYLVIAVGFVGSFFMPELGIATSMAMAAVVLTPEEEAVQKEVMTKISEQTKAQIETFRKEFSDLAAQAKVGAISKEVYDKQMADLNERLKAFDPAKFKEYQDKVAAAEKQLSEHVTALKVQSDEIKKMKDGGLGGSEAKPGLRAELKRILNSNEYKEFYESGGKKKVSFECKTVSITSDYTGSSVVHLTTRSNRVIDHPNVMRMNIRDLLTVGPTDLPYLSFLEVYDWVRAARPHSENESLAESSFKLRESTVQVKRIGTSLPISKRMLKSIPYLENHLATRLPAQVRYVEDFYLLFGDGAGNNPLGIFEVAEDFADIINANITGIAGDVASIATYDGGAKTIVNFTANTNINNGDTITFANADVAQYNDAFTALVVGPRQIVIEIAYSAEADVSDWTFSVTSKFKERIEAAQEIDVLKVAKTLVTREEYACTGYVLHPDDVCAIKLLKGNDEHYIDVSYSDNGTLMIAGIPVIETTAMPSGKFAVGDWTLGASLLEFTPLILEFSESTQEKLTNTVMAIVSEEIIFPIYNRFMFVVGDFVTAKAAIAVPPTT